MKTNKSEKAWIKYWRDSRNQYESMKNGYGCATPHTVVIVGTGIYVHGIGFIQPSNRKKVKK